MSSTFGDVRYAAPSSSSFPLEDDALHSRFFTIALCGSHTSARPAAFPPKSSHPLGSTARDSLCGSPRRTLRHHPAPRSEDTFLGRGVDRSGIAWQCAPYCGSAMMARRNLQLSRGNGARAESARGPSARGSRPSKRSAVRSRGLRVTKASKRLEVLARRHRGGSVVHAAMKRALRNVALRDCGQRCVYCATHLDHASATLDHVVPLARGGAHDSGNLVAACAPCNRLKGDLQPFEFFARHAWAGANFVRYARSVHRALKRGARRAVSLAFAREDARAA